MSFNSLKLYVTTKFAPTKSVLNYSVQYFHCVVFKSFNKSKPVTECSLLFFILSSILRWNMTRTGIILAFAQSLNIHLGNRITIGLLGAAVLFLLISMIILGWQIYLYYEHENAKKTRGGFCISFQKALRLFSA